jgi:hypothetical protein
MVMRATPSAPTSMTVLPFASLPIICLSAMIHNLSLSLASMGGNNSDQYHTQVCWEFKYTGEVSCSTTVQRVTLGCVCTEAWRRGKSEWPISRDNEYG